jgi:hypothetical protein
MTPPRMLGFVVREFYVPHWIHCRRDGMITVQKIRTHKIVRTTNMAWSMHVHNTAVFVNFESVDVWYEVLVVDALVCNGMIEDVVITHVKSLVRASVPLCFRHNINQLPVRMRDLMETNLVESCFSGIWLANFASVRFRCVIDDKYARDVITYIR